MGKKGERRDPTYISRFDFEAALRAAIQAHSGCHVQHRDTMYAVPNMKEAQAYAKASKGIATTQNESWDCDEAAEELDVKIRKKARKKSHKPPASGFIFANAPVGHAWQVMLVEEPEGVFTLYCIQPGSTALVLPSVIGLSWMYFALL